MEDGKCYHFTDGSWHLGVFAVNLKDARNHAGDMEYRGYKYPNQCPDMTCGAVTTKMKEKRNE